MKKLLVIDDDRKLCTMLSQYLGPEGFAVEAVHDGREGVTKASDGNFDLIVLDVMLPTVNGFEVLRHIRTQMDTPVVMLTARGDYVDRIIGLEMGADDYLPKPFNTRELVARIRTVLRRANQEKEEHAVAPSSKKLVVGDVEIDLGTRNVTCSGRPVELTSVEFNLLEHLLRNAGELVSREDLCKKVLGRRLTSYDRSIDGYISKLRKKLGHEVSGIERIRSIRCVGYLYALTNSSEVHVLEGISCSNTVSI
ncbi:response regulator transcription factor [Geobacter pelophilus]|uniref:Response regulator transcription factor n=1 Tax=Geoanaerobacter pelophilus TaxID=60036 RepID=A0AAW4L501_9BACT|nr:response regulator transcription factor [Geoanaerobacter pelophilus]MBT0664632.1 response regulator transcription factor [Geoanaerobacter pelophilus]